MIRFVILFSAFITFAYSEDCDVRNFPDGTVCVCSANYCDTVPSLDVSIGKYQVYSTSKSKLGFSSKTGLFSTQDPAQNVDNVKVDRSIKHQTIIGFGGAFTDSTGINIQSLPTEAQDKLMESYFGKSGIEYNLGRVPIGGTDFSTRAYSYDDFPLDTTLMKFALQPEDLNYKIPLIRKANILTNNKLNLFASAWTAPPWMKTNNDWHGIGFLQTKYYQLWADYMIKFLKCFLAYLGVERAVELGSWARGAKYIEDIFDNLQYGAGGWVDWNMALDETGGPNFIDNMVDSPIIVNATQQEFYKQPMFYAIGHFSNLSESDSDVQALAFLRPDNLTALVIYSSQSSDITIQIEDSNNQKAEIYIEANSINTVIYE
ncbi:hypothetical protein NQ314_020970 [Rhamnusium bicolor]|uniref:Glucosylceramidase n=1 Tax=Rhamnusium bicolor TaxID=1586634 RepID=A0AAV8WKA0_9CUCU|nr:hypothetical protein NQ314_020970 [Rhamnusium bicolor]